MCNNILYICSLNRKYECICYFFMLNSVVSILLFRVYFNFISSMVIYDGIFLDLECLILLIFVIRLLNCDCVRLVRFL